MGGAVSEPVCPFADIIARNNCPGSHQRGKHNCGIPHVRSTAIDGKIQSYRAIDLNRYDECATFFSQGDSSRSIMTRASLAPIAAFPERAFC